MKAITAKYIKSSYSRNGHNPLIDTLPAIKSDPEWLDQLLSLPKFHSESLLLPPHQRAYELVKLKGVFIPNDNHLEWARGIDQIIRWGYEHRNPTSSKRTAELQAAYDAAQQSGKAVKIVFDENKPIFSTSLLGVSGMGKSTTTESILHAYPQYYHHPDHDIHQVVWLKVECPKDGSIKELALNILRAFDVVLDTQHVASLPSRVTTTTLMAKVHSLALNHCLGVLVLDELQNLSVKKSGGREEMLNWFQELVNEFRLPIILLGTFKATSLLGLDVRHARRNAIMGSRKWDAMPLGTDFRTLLDTLWAHQWLRNPAVLDEETIQVIHEETQGITAFVVDMFLVAQVHTLQKRRETLTADIFKAVARHQFAPLQGFLSAMRSKDPHRISKFEDAANYEIENLLNQELLPQSSQRFVAAKNEISNIERSIADIRLSLGISEHAARELATSVFTGKEKSAAAITNAAIATHHAKSSKAQ